MPGWHEVKFDDSVLNVGGGGGHLPEGEYLFEIVKIEPSAESIDYSVKEPYLSIHLRAVDGNAAGKGKTLRTTCTLKADKQFALGNFLVALGYPLEAVKAKIVGLTFSTYRDFSAFAARISGQVGGRKVGGLVADSRNTSSSGQPYSEVVELYPEAAFPERFQAFAGHATAASNGTGTGAVAAAAESVL